MTQTTWSNWSGRISCTPDQILSPRDEAQLAHMVADAAAPVRMVGSGHSFTPIAASEATLLTPDHLTGLIEADPVTGLARVRAGTQLRDLGPALWQQGLSLPNQGDIDHQTIAGAISTGTHGTGRTLSCLSVPVTHLRFVKADGAIVDVDADSDKHLFDAARVSLGTLGVLSEVTLACRKAYRLAERQCARPVDDVLDNIETLASQHRHMEFFWFTHDDRVILKTLDEEHEGHADWPEAGPLPPIGEDTVEDVMFNAASTTVRFFPQTAPALHTALMDGFGEDKRKGPAFQIFPSPRNCRFNEMEYALPAEAGPAAIRAVAKAMREAHMPVMFPLEYRRVAGDGLWLSPFYDRDSATIAVHQFGPVDPAPLFELVEPILKDHGGLPHWGKMHTMTAQDISRRLPRFDDFCELRAAIDPKGRFLTPALKSLFDA